MSVVIKGRLHGRPVHAPAKSRVELARTRKAVVPQQQNPAATRRKGKA